MSFVLVFQALFVYIIFQSFLFIIDSQNTLYTTWLEDTIAIRSIYQKCDGINWKETWDDLNLDPCTSGSKHYPGISCELSWSNDFLRLQQFGFSSRHISLPTGGKMDKVAIYARSFIRISNIYTVPNCGWPLYGYSFIDHNV